MGTSVRTTNYVVLKATVLLLLAYNTRNNIPGKTFEYLRSGRPILAFGPEDGEAAKVLEMTGRRPVIAYQDYEEAYRGLKQYLIDYNDGKMSFFDDVQSIAQYSRKDLTRQLADVLEGICRT